MRANRNEAISGHDIEAVLAVRTMRANRNDRSNRRTPCRGSSSQNNAGQPQLADADLLARVRSSSQNNAGQPQLNLAGPGATARSSSQNNAGQPQPRDGSRLPRSVLGSGPIKLLA